ncbi:MAG: hypothetical protein M1511_06080 [Deltaproteobacteria bacterium]|jgi:hypothetical protein|nr:hypothetical protein [Deltaproteobacteria bacterium]
MFKKWPKPGFLISAELHSKITRSCEAITEGDSRVLDVRSVKSRFKLQTEVKSANNEFGCYFANH